MNICAASVFSLSLQSYFPNMLTSPKDINEFVLIAPEQGWKRCGWGRACSTYLQVRSWAQVQFMQLYAEIRGDYTEMLVINVS